MAASLFFRFFLLWFSNLICSYREFLNIHFVIYAHLYSSIYVPLDNSVLTLDSILSLCKNVIALNIYISQTSTAFSFSASLSSGQAQSRPLGGWASPQGWATKLLKSAIATFTILDCKVHRDNILHQHLHVCNFHTVNQSNLWKGLGNESHLVFAERIIDMLIKHNATDY